MNKYTTPVLKKGKEVKATKGSTKAIEQAKQTWLIEYYYNGKRFRITDGLNKIKDPDEKERKAEMILKTLKEDLEGGLNPNDPAGFYEQFHKINVSLAEGIEIFEKYHQRHNTRKKTIQTYESKLRALAEVYHYKGVRDISTKDLEKFVQTKIEDQTYSHNSVKAAKRIFSTFFNVLIKLEYVDQNPLQGFDKKIRSFKVVDDKHVPYSDVDLKRIFEDLDQNDPYCAFFCRMIYYTCMRPNEIRGLTVGDINLKNRTITIPFLVKKTTTKLEDEIIDINTSFLEMLEKLNLEQYPKNYFLVGSTTNIVGENRIGENTPYYRLITAFKRIDKKELVLNPELKESEKLVNKSYDLYSFKHLSNIKKYQAGWLPAEIQKANRHTNPSTTEIYLRKLGAFTDIKNLSMPTI